MDNIDLKILEKLQKEPEIAVLTLSRYVGLSKTACWNRLQRLEERGIISKRLVQMDRVKLGLPVVVFLSITVGQHTPAWVEQFHQVVDDYPEIVEVHRLTGEGADYQLKILSASIEAYDQLQQALISKIKFTSMATRIALSEIKSTPHLPLGHLPRDNE